MSSTFRIYENDEKDNLTLTSFVGGEKFGMAIQFTIGNRYFRMSEEQLFDLINVIQDRFDGKYTATGYNKVISVNINGKKTFTGEYD